MARKTTTKEETSTFVALDKSGDTVSSLCESEEEAAEEAYENLMGHEETDFDIYKKVATYVSKPTKEVVLSFYNRTLSA